MPGEIKTIQNAWVVITEFEYLCEADHNARKGKRYRQEILAFTAAFEHNLFVIQAQMQGGTYILGPYRKLWVFVPKKRLVMALRYPDVSYSGAYTSTSTRYTTNSLSRTRMRAGKIRAVTKRHNACNTGCGRSAGNQTRSGTT